MPPTPAQSDPAIVASPPGGAARNPAAWLTRAVRVTGAFALFMALALLVQHFLSRSADPWKSPALAKLHETLRAAPKDDGIKEQIRTLDLRLRQRYFRHLDATRTGAWLLLATAAAFFAGARVVTAVRARPHFPRPEVDPAARQTRAVAGARVAVLIAASLFGLGLAGLTLTRSTPLPQETDAIDKFLAKLAGAEDESAAAPPDPAEFLANWPRFLGPTGNAFTTNSALPLFWDIGTGSNVVWKTAIPTTGFNSPIVWSNRVFLSGGDSTQRVVCAFDLASGALLWRQPVVNVPGSPTQLPKIPESTGFAAPTMATDGRRAFAIFANGDLVAFRFDGALAWARNLGLPKNHYGHATSLALWQTHLVVQFDQGDAEQGQSRLYAFDCATGRPLWERTRPVGESWSSPIVIATTPPQIVALGGQWAIGYGLGDGAELWRADLLVGEVAPSPIFVNGLVMVPSPTDKLVALRPDGKGDVTKTHVVWTAEDNLPDIGSPASNGALVFIVNTSGVLTCYDAKTGKKQWEHELEFEVNASPAIAGPHLLVLGRTGAAVIAEAAATEFKPVARLELGEPVYASPALVQNRLVVRTARTLLCLGPAGATPQPESQRP